MMTDESPAILRAIFSMKGDLARGRPSAMVRKVLSGIEVTPFKDNAEAASCISADFELGWGWRSRGLEGAELMGEKERCQVPLILDLLEEYLDPDHMGDHRTSLLRELHVFQQGRGPPSMPRPVTDGSWGGDWYSQIPAQTCGKLPRGTAPDLIQQIAETEFTTKSGPIRSATSIFSASAPHPTSFSGNWRPASN